MQQPSKIHLLMQLSFQQPAHWQIRDLYSYHLQIFCKIFKINTLALEKLFQVRLFRFPHIVNQIIFAISLVDGDLRPLIIPNNFDPNISKIDIMPPDPQNAYQAMANLCKNPGGGSLR